MPAATHLSLFLARFDSLRSAPVVASPAVDACLFRSVAAETRAAAMRPASQQAFKFMVLELHAAEAQARDAVDSGRERMPWLDEAAEVWSAMLQPYRHFGEANYLDRAEPGALFDSLGASPKPGAPIVIVTSSGWTVGEGLDMNRVRDFANGVPGLYSQQSFFFPNVLEYDPITVTLWRDSASARAFAYGQEQNLADRTSLTRCRIIKSQGSWHGSTLS